MQEKLENSLYMWCRVFFFSCFELTFKDFETISKTRFFFLKYCLIKVRESENHMVQEIGQKHFEQNWKKTRPNHHSIKHKT